MKKLVCIAILFTLGKALASEGDDNPGWVWPGDIPEEIWYQASNLNDFQK